MYRAWCLRIACRISENTESVGEPRLLIEEIVLYCRGMILLDKDDAWGSDKKRNDADLLLKRCGTRISEECLMIAGVGLFELSSF